MNKPAVMHRPSEDQQSEARYRGLLEAAPDAMVVVNQLGEIVLLNVQAEKQFGYRRDELLGQLVTNIIPEGFAERIIADGTRTAAEALAQQIGTGIELLGCRRDGSIFPIEIMLSPLESDEGILVTAAIRDISVRKAADRHLAQMENRYRGLLEAAPDAMVVVDQLGKIVLLNVQAEKQFGYSRDELVGQRVTNIIPVGFAERIIADGTRTAAEALEQQIGTGIELNALRKDGTEFPIEIMLSPLESADGILVTAAIRDITVRRESDARYRGLLEAAPDAMVVVDQAGEIVLLNVQAEKQFGYSRDELVGQPVTNIIPVGFAERIIADGTRTAAEALAQQIGTGIELNALRKDGTEFPIEIMLSPLESADGTLVTAAIRDITVRRESDARYRGLLEAAPDAMVVVDQAGEIVLLNVQAEKQFGYSRDELVGQPVTNIIPVGFAERIIADGTRTAAEAFAQQIGTGIELNALRKDGTEFPIEIMLSPLESADGILVTAAIRDITVRRESDARYRGLLEAAPDAMVVVDQSGEIVLLNVQAEKQFGYRRDELVGQRVTNIIPVGFAERIIADGTRTAAEALGQQIGTGIELNALRKDGTEFPIEIMLSPLESADGILFTAAIRDITVRRESEARYRGLLEAAPDAMVVVDQRGEIVLLNVQAEKQFGYSRDELVGQAVTNIIPEGFEERLIADALRSTEDALAQQIGTGIELYGQRKDGNRFPIEIMLSPLASAGGVLVTAAIRDITLRHAADEALRVAHRKSESVLNSLNDGLAVLDKNWVYTYFNEQGAKIIGMRREELMGRHIWDLFPQLVGSKFYENYHRAVDTGQSVHFEEFFPDPINQWLECHCHPSPDGLSVYFRDVTLAKKADTNLVLKVEELKRSNEELEQFAYIASHDLQEPLRMVASYTQLLSRKYKGQLDSDADEFIAFAVDGATRMQALIKDLLEFSRVGTKGKEFVAVSSEDALKQALRNLRGAIEDSETVIAHDLLPMVSADEVQLVQLFQNLVGNAIKYQQGKAPRINIAAFKNRSSRWEFSVGDNGLGIEPQYFERIFGMFQRLHKREEFAGTGIGLAICKKIVERHGGSISVQSTLGEGSTFHFDLTAVEGSAA